MCMRLDHWLLKVSKDGGQQFGPFKLSYELAIYIV